jgi:hypothetical protein
VISQGFHRGFTAAEKTELWDRWQRGESLKAIGRAFSKPSFIYYFTRARLTVGQEVGSFESQLTLRPSSSIITHSNRVSSNQSLCCRETEFSWRKQIGQNGFKGSGTP